MSAQSSHVVLSDKSQSLLSEIFSHTPVNVCVDADSMSLDTAKQSSLTTLELVVFADMSLAQFVEITTLCRLTNIQLTAINNRLNKTSLRFAVTAADLKTARIQLCQYGQANQLEAILIENAPEYSQPGILVMDMDSTTIKIECIDEIAALAGVGEQVAEVTELAMQGKLDFAQSLHQRVATLADAPENILQQVVDTIPLMEGLETLIDALKQHQWRIAIASGGFTYFAEHLQAQLALDDTFANTLEIIDGKLTGKVLGDVVDAQAKADSLVTLSAKYNIKKSQTVAMGDGANDLTMMAAAQLGVAFHAKPIVQQQAAVTINHQGLDCLVHWLA